MTVSVLLLKSFFYFLYFCKRRDKAFKSLKTEQLFNNTQFYSSKNCKTKTNWKHLTIHCWLFFSQCKIFNTYTRLLSALVYRSVTSSTQLPWGGENHNRDCNFPRKDLTWRQETSVENQLTGERSLIRDRMWLNWLI